MTDERNSAWPKQLGEFIAWDVIRWIVVVTGWIPGLLGIGVRFVAYKPLLRSSQGFYRILERVVIEYPHRLTLGSKVGINTGCWISARGEVRIGDNTILGPSCMIHSANHRTNDLTVPIRLQGYEYAPVVIGSNVWLGGHAVVLPGVTIGDNAIIGAGAVVTRDVPANAIAVGVPARVRGMRGEDPALEREMRAT